MHASTCFDTQHISVDANTVTMVVTVSFGFFVMAFVVAVVVFGTGISA